jgi:hypothetical protein
MDLLNLTMNFPAFYSYLVMSSLIPPFYPYTTSKDEGGKYLNKFSEGDLQVEV